MFEIISYFFTFFYKIFQSFTSYLSSISEYSFGSNPTLFLIYINTILIIINEVPPKISIALEVFIFSIKIDANIPNTTPNIQLQKLLIANILVSILLFVKLLKYFIKKTLYNPTIINFITYIANTIVKIIWIDKFKLATSPEIIHESVNDIPKNVKVLFLNFSWKRFWFLEAIPETIFKIAKTIPIYFDETFISSNKLTSYVARTVITEYTVDENINKHLVLLELNENLTASFNETMFSSSSFSLISTLSNLVEIINVLIFRYDYFFNLANIL